jgi:hypothetical protein
MLVLYERGASGSRTLGQARELIRAQDGQLTVVTVAPRETRVRGTGVSARDYNDAVRDSAQRELDEAHRLLGPLGAVGSKGQRAARGGRRPRRGRRWRDRIACARARTRRRGRNARTRRHADAARQPRGHARARRGLCRGLPLQRVDRARLLSERLPAQRRVPQRLFADASDLPQAVLQDLLDAIAAGEATVPIAKIYTRWTISRPPTTTWSMTASRASWWSRTAAEAEFLCARRPPRPAPGNPRFPPATRSRSINGEQATLHMHGATPGARDRPAVGD